MFGIEKLTRVLAQVRQEVKDGFSRLERIARPMATQADVDAAVAKIETAVQDLGADLLKAIAALKVTPDQQATVDALNKIGEEIAGFDASVEAELPPVV